MTRELKVVMTDLSDGNFPETSIFFFSNNLVSESVKVFVTFTMTCCCRCIQGTTGRRLPLVVIHRADAPHY